HEDAVLGVFTKGFKDDNTAVRIAAMDAFSSFFLSIPKKSQPKFYPVMPDLLNILPPLKESSDSEELSSGFLALIELAGISPKMFKGMFNNL
ncbi:Importin beta-3 subunit, partial [Aspergillus sclerotialis]